MVLRHVVLFPMCFAVAHAWSCCDATVLCSNLQDEHEQAELAVLKQDPCTLWALPFVSDPTLSALSDHPALLPQATASPALPKSSQPSLSQPLPTSKPSGDGLITEPADFKPRAVAPAGPAAILPGNDSKQTASHSQDVHVTAYLPSSPGKPRMAAQPSRGNDAALVDKCHEQAAGQSDATLTDRPAATLPKNVQGRHVTGQAEDGDAAVAAGKGHDHGAKAPHTAKQSIKSVAEDNQVAASQHHHSQHQAEPAHIQTAQVQQTKSSSTVNHQKQQKSAADTDVVSHNVEEFLRRLDSNVGSSALAAQAAQESMAQSQLVGSKKRPRDEQQIGGPTRSGSPADSPDPPARGKSEASDPQPAGQVSKQARARRAKQASSTAAAASDEQMPAKQQTDTQLQTGKQSEKPQQAQQLQADDEGNQIALKQQDRPSKQDKKRQGQQSHDQAPPSKKKARQTAAGTAPKQGSDSRKAADPSRENPCRSSKDRDAEERQPEVKPELPSQTVHNIFDSLKQLGLHRNIQGKGELSRREVCEEGSRRPLLVQLRILSHYGTKFQVRGDPERFWHLTSQSMVKQCRNTNWLAQRVPVSASGSQSELTQEADSLQEQLVNSKMLPKDAVPEIAPRVLPAELQPAYVLALGGYAGKGFSRFAQKLLHSILWQVCWAVRQHNSSSQTFKVAMDSYEMAVGWPFKLPAEAPGTDADTDTWQVPTRGQAVTAPCKGPSAANAATATAAHDSKHAATGKPKHTPIPVPGSKPAPHPQGVVVSHVPTFANGLPLKSTKAKTATQWDAGKAKQPHTIVTLSRMEVADTAFLGLVRLGKLHSDSLDDICLNFLHKQSPLWQLRILSFFSQQVKFGNASAFLTTICKGNKAAAAQKDFRWIEQSAEIEAHARTLLNKACTLGLLSKELTDTEAYRSIPADLHSVAVCFAVGRCAAKKGWPQRQQQNTTVQPSGQSSSPALAALHIIIQYAQQLMEEEAPTRLPLAPLKTPTRPHSAHSAGVPHPPQPSLKAQNSFPSFDRPASLQHASQPSQQQAQHPQHAQHGAEELDRPCPSFHRSSGGCDTRNCPYIHDSHQQYVDYMKHVGLVPYGVKFGNDAGQDRWVPDEAVDVLNGMLVHGSVPRGSFGDWSMHCLACLEDPVGENNPARLQLQVSRLAPFHRIMSGKLGC